MQSIYLKQANKLSSKIAYKLIKKSIKEFLYPIGYTRTKEIPYLLELSDIYQKKNELLRILDIGSPQQLSLILASISEKWDVLYINPYDVELEDMDERKKILNLKNITTKCADITDTNIDYLSEPFDYIFSCSVFEHIYPEDKGEKIAAEN